MESPRMLTTEPNDDDLELDPPTAEAVQKDLDPDEWLARDEGSVMGRVSVRGGTLRVASLIQSEMTMLRKQASKVNPRGGERIVNSDLLNRYVIGYAIAKGKNPTGAPVEVLAEAEGYLKPLNSKLTGELTEIARKILRVSGFVDDAEREDLPFD